MFYLAKPSAGLDTCSRWHLSLLSRLRRDRFVTTTWRESDAGPPRRYYRITEEGRRALDGFARDWARFRDAVDALLAATTRGGTDGG